MKKLSKLQINSDKLMKDEELITLRGGYGCGDQIEWLCDVSVEGTFAFSGRACGSQSYVTGVCDSLGYSCSCTQQWNAMPIFT